MQLVYFSHSSSRFSTRVLLARTARTTVDVGCALSERLGPLLNPDSLAGTNLLVDATTCAVCERLGPLLDPGSLADTNRPADTTACAISERFGPLLDPGSLAGTNCPADATACVVMTRPTVFRVQESCDSWLLQAPSETSPRKPLVLAPRRKEDS